ncbi:hypothetical protein PybrP1_000140 [[Pythium] brassicae (nom. inval.)]|nr:hypothetical protein PybrP1_000140 [[Pythium] brassicae (nom. inval.)]
MQQQQQPSVSPPPASAVGVLSKRKGVRYSSDGQVLSCRFCEILRRRDEPFVFEDERVAVFRPLRPIAASHILVVPRAHIRNVHLLASDHEALLRHMRRVAERVLLDQADAAKQGRALHTNERPQCDGKCDDDDDENPAAAGRKLSNASSKGTDEDEDACGAPPTRKKHPSVKAAATDATRASSLKFAFHVPPFNSIDHVHMHAFRDEPRERVGIFGRVKYRTESWWCRSYDAVLLRLRATQHRGGSTSRSGSSHNSSSLSSRSLGSGSGRDPLRTPVQASSSPSSCPTAAVCSY